MKRKTKKKPPCEHEKKRLVLAHFPSEPDSSGGYTLKQCVQCKDVFSEAIEVKR